MAAAGRLRRIGSRRGRKALKRALPGVTTFDPGLPPAQGLYDPRNEHDSCGVGFIANMHNQKSHDIINKGLEILLNLDHRGAVGADPKAGDGCGMLVQMPHRFFAAEAGKLGFKLPAVGDYAAGLIFLPRDAEIRSRIEALIESIIVAEGQTLLAWRDVPVDSSGLGESIKPTEPVMRQLFIQRGLNAGRPGTDSDEFERRLFILRKEIANAVLALNDPR